MVKKEAGDDPQVYDFSEINDKARSAIVLAHEAVKDEEVMNSLPDEVVEFFKSAAKELDLETIKVELDKAAHPDEDEEEKKKRLEKLKKAEEEAESKKKTEMIKSAFPGVLESVQRAVVEPLQVEIKKAQDQIEELTGKLQRDEMRELAKTLTSNGDDPSDAKVDELVTIKKSMDDKGWTSYLESQRGLITQIEKSQLFERQANPAASTPGSAYEELQSIANGIVEKSEDKNPGLAWDHAVKTNPALYDKYRKEQAAQATAGVPS